MKYISPDFGIELKHFAITTHLDLAHFTSKYIRNGVDTRMDYPQNLTASDRYWFDLIQKCRTSGKSDYQWLKDNNIKSPTFYYHVKQLRKKACELPEPKKRTYIPEVQEVVPVFFKDEETSVPTASSEPIIPEASDGAVAVRLQIRGISCTSNNQKGVLNCAVWRK